MSFFVAGEKVKIKSVSPIDFIEAGVPVSIFLHARPKTMYEQTMGASLNEDIGEDEQRELYTKIAEVALVTENGGTLSREKLASVSIDLLKEIYSATLLQSLNLFSRIYALEENHILLIDGMAKRYGKTPIEILAADDPELKYNALDAYMFNVAVMTKAKEEEARRCKKS